MPVRIPVEIRPVSAAEHAAWLPLWQGYQRFYMTEIPAATSEVTWQRFLDPAEPMHAALAWHVVFFTELQGGISPRYPAESPIVQRLLLEAEGVGFDAADRIDLSRYRWHPEAPEEKNQRRSTQYTGQTL